MKLKAFTGKGAAENFAERHNEAVYKENILWIVEYTENNNKRK